MATVTLTFKTTEARARALRRAAKARNMTLSDYLRRAADQAAITPAKAHPDFTARSRAILGAKANTPINVLDLLG
jgi:hypothetical protein